MMKNKAELLNHADILAPRASVAATVNCSLLASRANDYFAGGNVDSSEFHMSLNRCQRPELGTVGETSRAG
jgi:hypothetical protein